MYVCMCVHVSVLIVYSYVSVYNVSIKCMCKHVLYVCMYVCMYVCICVLYVYLMGEDVWMYVWRYVHIMYESIST